MIGLYLVVGMRTTRLRGRPGDAVVDQSHWGRCSFAGGVAGGAPRFTVIYSCRLRRGEERAQQRGETMPEGWMIDREGRPLTDPARRRRLPPAHRRLQGLRPRAVRASRRHAERRRDGQGRHRLQPRPVERDQYRAGDRGDRRVGVRRGGRSRAPGRRRCGICARAVACPASSVSGCPGEQSHACVPEYARQHSISAPLLDDSAERVVTEWASRVGLTAGSRFDLLKDDAGF